MQVTPRTRRGQDQHGGQGILSTCTLSASVLVCRGMTSVLPASQDHWACKRVSGVC